MPSGHMSAQSGALWPRVKSWTVAARPLQADPRLTVQFLHSAVSEGALAFPFWAPWHACPDLHTYPYPGPSAWMPVSEFCS